MTPVFWMLLSTFFFATLSALVKKLNYLPVWEVVFLRSFINFLFLMPWLKDFLASEWRKEYKALLIRGLSGCLSMLLYFYALEHLHLADAVMLNYSSPIPTLILSAFFLNERISFKSIVFIIIGLSGVALILKPDLNVSSIAGIAGFLSAFIAAIAYVSMKVATKALSSKVIVFSFAGISSLVTFIPTGIYFVSPKQNDYPFILIMGFVATLAQLTMTKAYSGLPASIASPLSLVTVLFSTLFGFIFWNEVPDQYSIAGAILLAIGLTGAYQFRPKS